MICNASLDDFKINIIVYKTNKLPHLRACLANSNLKKKLYSIYNRVCKTDKNIKPVDTHTKLARQILKFKKNKKEVV